MHRSLLELGEINPSSNLPEIIEYVDLESVKGTRLETPKKLHIESAPSRAKRLAQRGDIFYQTVRPYQKNNYYFNKKDINFVFSTGYAQIRPDEINGEFLFYKLQTQNFVNKVLRRSTGTSYPAINSKDLSKIKIKISKSFREQERIGILLKKMDDIITLEQEKYELLEEYKNYFIQNVFTYEHSTVKSLKEVASIATGKLNANAMDENGKYDFYTSGINKYKINEYAFEGPAITIAGNGATVGYMHMTNGKFNAYQRTYVLQDFKINKHYLYYNIQKELPKKIHEESRTGSIPYIVMDMLEDLPIYVVEEKLMNQFGDQLHEVDSILEKSSLRIKKVKKLKKFLLECLFI